MSQLGAVCSSVTMQSLLASAGADPEPASTAAARVQVAAASAMRCRPVESCSWACSLRT
jgi:hypothetical protein